MELAIIILVIFIMIQLDKKGRAFRAQKKHGKRQFDKSDADELITTILPTTKNDKLKK